MTDTKYIYFSYFSIEDLLLNHQMPTNFHQTDERQAAPLIVAVSRCLGGFNVSDDAIDILRNRHRLKLDKWAWSVENKDFGIESENEYEYRADPRLIDAIKSAPTRRADHSDIEFLEIPAESYFVISNYDGSETLHYSRTPIVSL